MPYTSLDYPSIKIKKDVMVKVKPVNPGYVSTIKNPIIIEHTINASTQDIWLIISDNSTWIHWYPDRSKCEITSTKTELGSTRRVRQSWWLSDELIVLWEPTPAWGYTLVSYNAAIFTHLFEQVKLEVINDGNVTAKTVIRYTGAYEAHWLVWFYLWQIRLELSRLWKKALKGLKRCHSAHKP